MDRSRCMMAESYGNGNEVYCGYYDIACMLCHENEHCPEEEDEDNEDYEEIIEDDENTDFDN